MEDNNVNDANAKLSVLQKENADIKKNINKMKQINKKITHKLDV